MRGGNPFTLLAGAAALFALCGCSALERSLIFPGQATQRRADALLDGSANYELVELRTQSGDRIVAQFGRALAEPPAGANAARPTLIYFYGNGSCVAYSQQEFDRFRRLGLNVLIPEYPGYGMSDGRASERNCYEAADAAYDYVSTRKDVASGEIFAAGWSLGGAVAIDLASRRDVRRLVTISAFTTMPAVARSVAPWAPTSLIIRSRFDNLAKLPRISCPILLVHGMRDTLVPHAMSHDLAASVSHGSIRRLDLPHSAHNDIFLVEAERLWRELAAFLETQPVTASSGSN